MSSVLAIGAWGLEACRKKIAAFLADWDGRLCSIEVRLFSSDGARVKGMNEWRPKKDDDLGRIAEQIARYIVEHRSSGATIFVRDDG